MIKGNKLVDLSKVIQKNVIECLRYDYSKMASQSFNEGESVSLSY